MTELCLQLEQVQKLLEEEEEEEQYENTESSRQEEEEEVNSHVDNDSMELYDQIDECERELRALGVDILGHENDDGDHHDDASAIPREIQTLLDSPQQTSPLVHCSMGLAQSLIGLLSQETHSNEEEEFVWTQLAQLSELIKNNESMEYVYDVVPLYMYQRLEQHCHVLEKERTDLKREMLQMLASAREANALQLQLAIEEVKEQQAQRRGTLHDGDS